MSHPVSRTAPRLVLAAIAASAMVIAGPASVASAATLDIGIDPYTQATCQASSPTNHRANVEPDSFSSGSTIVAAYQVGRIYNGGACAIGFSTSTNNGASWSSGLLPGMTKWTAVPGTNDRASDPVVAFDARHNAWLISSLTLLETPSIHGNAVVTSRSTDGGLTWGNPAVTAAGADLD